VPWRASVRKSDAVRLFVERARDVRPDFELTDENAKAVAAICRRLDGLPLALELAATRIRVRDPDAVLNLLSIRLPVLTGAPRDAPMRQRTLRDTIDWSYGLLTPAEQRLLRCLSVFQGAWSFQAAAMVCDLDGSSPQAMPEQVESLTAQSLLVCNPVVRGGSRFVMLETIREFASERLVKSGEADAIAARHAAWCLDIAEASARDLMGPAQPDVLAGLEAQHDDIRAALEWMSAHNQGEMLARLVAAMCWFWALRTHYAKGARWAATALAMTLSREGHTEALFAAGLFAWYQGDLERARTLGEECLASCRASRDAHGEGKS
jgi:predicted ATPase